MSGFFNRGLVCLVGALLSSVMPVRAADDYLSILEAEADDTSERSHATTDTPFRAVKKVRSVRDNQIIRPAMGFEEFEAELNEYYSGTWFLYEKLTAEQRKAVFGTYQDDNRTAKVREAVVRLLSGR